jgi:hypothetical protein
MGVPTWLRLGADEDLVFPQMRTLQEWMGHRDIKTTLIYADYAPSAQEKAMVERAFSPLEVDGEKDDSEAQLEAEDSESEGPLNDAG